MRSRRGFTLIEMLLAVVILTIVATSVARFAATFSRSMGDAAIRVMATAAATDRLELIRADPRYARLTTLYGISSAGGDTTGFPGFPTMRRTTTVVRDTSGTSGSRRDRTTVTVRIMAPPVLRDTVALTVTIASP
jgi:prepilin-type N-terminal cleavage/methylation domain-containing protein